MNTKNTTPETTILSEMEKLIRLFSFYPEGHSYLAVASTRIFNTIQQQLGGVNTAIYSVDRRNISIGSVVLDGFGKLSKLLFYKRIKALIIHNTVKLQELITFVQLVSRGDLILPRDKSMKQLLLGGNISGIEVEEVDYDTIREELEEESDQQVETPEDTVELENVVQDLSDDEQEAIRFINLIDKEANPLRYAELSDALIVIIQRLVDIEKYEIPLIAIRTYTQHAYQNKRGQTIVAMAGKQVGLIALEKGMLQQVTAPIAMGNPYYYDSSIAIATIVGEPAMQELSEIMIKTETMQSLKFIARALSVFGKDASHHLEKIMLSGNYRAASVAIDTAAGMKPAPEHTVAHGLKSSDVRIKKRSLQALFDLNTTTGNSIIDKLIAGAPEQRMISLTISMIGKYKRTAFVPRLQHLLSDEAIPYSIKHDALLVLGEIGGRDAVNVIITSIFGSAALLPKQYPEIKLAGIKALALTMNEVALANLVKLLENKDAHIRGTAWSTLYEVGKRINV